MFCMFLNQNNDNNIEDSSTWKIRACNYMRRITDIKKIKRVDGVGRNDEGSRY